MKYANMWKTPDFYSAVILRTLNFPLELLERNNNGQVTFVFADEHSKAEQVIKDYWDRKLSILDARAFVEAINELKTRLYGDRK